MTMREGGSKINHALLVVCITDATTADRSSQARSGSSPQIRYDAGDVEIIGGLFLGAAGGCPPIFLSFTLHCLGR